MKAFVFFKGRSIIFKEQGQILLLKLAQELEEYGKVEQLPTLEGKKNDYVCEPKKDKKVKMSKQKTKSSAKKRIQGHGNRKD